MRICLVYPNLRGEFRPNLGLLSIASYLDERTDHEVSLLDLTFHRRRWRKYVRDFIRREKPDVIGFSCMTHNFHDAILIAREIMKFHEATIIMGGIHPTLAPEEVISREEVDAISIGESEITLAEYLDTLERGGDLRNVKGIWYKENGKVFRNQSRPRLEDLDMLPFAKWEFYDVEKYMITNPYQLDFMASRGCPYSCTFCFNHALRNSQPGKYVRYRSPKNVIEEIKVNKEKYYRKGFRYVYFYDDNFVFNKKFLHEFCRLFVEEGLHEELAWKCTARANLLTEDDVKMMKAANCNTIEMGVEAGDDYIRNEVYKRNLSLDEIRRGVELCRKWKINIQLNFIFGGPRETIETMKRTFEVARELDPEQISLAIFQPFPGIMATEMLRSDGAIIHYEKWSEGSGIYDKSIVTQKNLTPEQVERFVRMVNLYFIRRYIRKALSERGIRFLLDALVFLIYLKPRYGFLWHDSYKYTWRKYVYERSLP